MTDKSQLSFLCKLRIFELYFIQDNTLSKGNQIHMEKQVTFSGNEAFWRLEKQYKECRGNNNA